MFKKYFKKFDFRGFVDFIYDLVDIYNLGEIRFFPDHRELFDERQLSHVAPGRNINNKNGFVWAWRQKEKEVRKVSFDSFRKNGGPKITMSINLDKKFISLNKVEGISSVQIEEALKNNLDIHEKRYRDKLFDFFRKYFSEIILLVIVGLIVSFLVYKFGWGR